MSLVTDSLIAESLTVEVVGTGSDSNADPLSITIPANTKEGDLCLYAFQGTNNNPGGDGPEGSGWTEIFKVDVGSGEWQSAWYKLATSTDETNAGTGTWDWDIATSNCAAALAVYRGASSLWSYSINQGFLIADPPAPTRFGLFVAVLASIGGAAISIVGDDVVVDVSVVGGASTNRVLIARSLYPNTVAPIMSVSGRGGNTSFDAGHGLVFY